MQANISESSQWKKVTSSKLFDGPIVPWNNSGQYLPERPSFTLDPNFHAGRYYVQEAGSMFLAFLLKQIQTQHHIKTALDLCAAPGGKTTLLLNHLPDDSLIVANEVIKSRYGILQENLVKWGRSNVISTQGDSQQFAELAGQFDLVLVDAPCSGEGLFRKTPASMKEWSRDHVQLCEHRQRRILSNAMPLVREGGFLIYSTCTYNPYENDGNVRWMMEQGGFDLYPLDLPEDWAIKQTKGGYQFYPHRTTSEGFYISILQKNAQERSAKKLPSLRYFSLAGKSDKEIVNNWVANIDNYKIIQDPKQNLFLLPRPHQTMLVRLSQFFSKITPGTPLGIIKGKDLVPDHAWALSIHQHEQIPSVTLDLASTLSFLRKQDFALPDGHTSKGWHLINYQEFGLGWVKVLQNRINNYFPNHLRIRKS
ncbi:MAG: RNA methyltransferase [Bacteroidota bacterium]